MPKIQLAGEKLPFDLPTKLGREMLLVGNPAQDSYFVYRISTGSARTVHKT